MAPHLEISIRGQMARKQTRDNVAVGLRRQCPLDKKHAGLAIHKTSRQRESHAYHITRHCVARKHEKERQF
jgi:hypothetical protein